MATSTPGGRGAASLRSVVVVVELVAVAAPSGAAKGVPRHGRWQLPLESERGAGETQTSLVGKVGVSGLKNGKEQPWRDLWWWSSDNNESGRGCC